MVSCIGRIIGPAVAAPVFAWSISGEPLNPPPLNHFFVFLLCTVLQLANAAVAMAMPRSIDRPAEESSERECEGDEEEEEALLPKQS